MKNAKHYGHPQAVADSMFTGLRPVCVLRNMRLPSHMCKIQLSLSFDIRFSKRIFNLYSK